MAKAKYTRGTDGFFRTKIWDGTYNENGSKHRACLSSKKSSADLERQVNELKNNIAQGKQVQSTEITFLEYAREWKKTYKAIRSTGTRNMYENIIEKHLIALDGVKLRDIRRLHLQLVINNNIDKQRTCQQINLTFKQIINAAIADKYLPASALQDICAGVELQKYKPRERRPLTDQEVKAIKTADFSPLEKTFVLIAYGCGLRRGEILALKKDLDIDLKHATLTVRQAVEFDGNNPALKAPKSANGLRTVPIPPYLVDHLKTYIPTVKGSYLICKRDGGMMTKSSYDKMWRQIVKEMNLAAGGTDQLQVIHGLTAHIFRHNYCTNLCYQIPKISTKKIAQMMGDTEAMVLNVYSHIREEKENAEEVVNEAFAL